MTVKTIVDSFQTKPYGWDLASIEVVIALLGRHPRRSRSPSTATSSSAPRSPPRCATRRSTRTPWLPRRRPSTSARSPRSASSAPTSSTKPTRPKDPLELARHGADKLKGKLDELKATVTGSKYPFVAQLAAPIDLLDQAVGKPDDWYLTDFDLGDDLLDAKENLDRPDPGVPQRRAASHLRRGCSTADAPTAATSATCRRAATRAVRNALDDPNAFRGNRMAQLKQAAEAAAQAQIEEARRDQPHRRGRRPSRAARPSCSQRLLRQGDDRGSGERRSRRSTRRSARVGSENQIALIRELGTSFEESDLPGAARPARRLAGPRAATDRPEPTPVKQTVSVKTISVPGVTGVLESRRGRRPVPRRAPRRAAVRP